MPERGESLPTRLPAPVGGLNTRDNPAGVPLEDALDLINLFPESDSAVIRGGAEVYIESGLGSTAIDTLAVLRRGGAEQMLAGANNTFYEVTTATPSLTLIGALTITEDRWSWIEFDDASTYATPELLLVNGTDQPAFWTGTGNVQAWTFGDASGAFSGVTSPTLSSFTGIAAFKNRVFMWPADSRDFWFGHLGQRPGTAVGTDDLTRFPLSGVRGVQGTIIAMETWTRDGGDGPDDFLVIITDVGQAIIYAGSDPGDATLWSLVGVYTIPPPLDGRAVGKVLDDVLIVTEQDVYLLSQVVRTQGISGSESKIAARIKTYAGLYGDTAGWEFALFPRLQRGYVNVPTSGATSRQLVVNTRTLAWTEYEGWDARTFAEFKGDLYYGDGAGKIFRAEIGNDDDGAAYTWRYSSGFIPLHLGYHQLQAMRPTWGASETFDWGYEVNRNFSLNRASAPTTTGDSTGWTWAGGTWSTIRWNTLDNTQIADDWVLLEGGAQNVGISIAATTNDIAIRLYSVDLLWTPGGRW